MKKLLLIVLIASCTPAEKTASKPQKKGQRQANQANRPKKNNQNNQGNYPASGETGTATTVNTNYEMVDPGNLKKPLTGLVCRDFDRIDVTNGSDDDMMKITNGIVIQLYWKDIQLQQNGPVVRDNKVDKAIEWVRKFKARHGVEIPIKIRLYSGMASPEWLLNKGYFMFNETKMAKYWEQFYIDAHVDIQKKLAALYDNVPEISEIEDGATGEKSAENFIRPFGNTAKKPMANRIYLDAGYTKQNDSIAIVKSYDAMTPWKKTLISVCFSSYQYVDKNGVAYESASETLPFIDMFVQKFGKQAVVGNNGLRTTEGRHGEDFEVGGERYKLYNYFKLLHDTKGVAIYFQTATTERQQGELAPVIEEGIKYGAMYIELPTKPKEYRAMLGTKLETLNAAVKKNQK